MIYSLTACFRWFLHLVPDFWLVLLVQEAMEELGDRNQIIYHPENKAKTE